MKLSEIKTMKPGDEIRHKRYGRCSIKKIEWFFSSLFGVVVQPETAEGKALLASDCGTPDIPLMEGSLRQLEKLPEAVTGGEAKT